MTDNEMDRQILSAFRDDHMRSIGKMLMANYLWTETRNMTDPNEIKTIIKRCQKNASKEFSDVYSDYQKVKKALEKESSDD